MPSQWDEKTPIYLQVREQTVAMILDGRLKAGDPLPSVRSVAADLQINPLTVSKAYQLLVDEGLVESRRGLGMYVIEGSKENSRAHERERFLHEQWPTTLERAKRLGLSLDTLMQHAKRHIEDKQ